MLRPKEIPIFAAGLELRVVGPELAYLVGERESFSLQGALAVSVATWIDGERTVDQILACAGETPNEIEVLGALDVLSARGLLTALAPELPRHEQAFWQLLNGATANTPGERGSRIAVRALGSSSPALLRAALEGAGVVWDEEAADCLVMTDDYLHPELPAAYADREQRRGRFILVKPSGTSLWFGPVLGEAYGPCLVCLRHWLSRNEPVRASLRGSRERARAPASVASSLAVAAHLAALGVAGLLAAGERPHPLSGRLIELDLQRFELQHHPVLKRPQCPGCGDPGLMAATGAAPIRLKAVPRPFTDDGGFRSVHPRVTYERHAHLISRLTGAVTHVSPMPERDTPLRAVYTSGYRVTPHAAKGRAIDFYRPCAGKGKTPEQARASALCEALERYSGVYQGDEARVRGSWRTLAPRAIHPDELQHFSRAQRSSAAMHEQEAPHLWVAQPFDETLELDWTPAWSFTRDAPRLIPLAYCFSEIPASPVQAYCRNSANGAAAGNTLEEAILQGLLELVERDAAAVWWYNRVRRPAFDLDRLCDPYIESLRRDYARLGWSTWALDLTHDLGIPVSVAVARRDGQQEVCIGLGCHLSPLLAVQRSFTELNQLFAPEDARGVIANLARLPNLDFTSPATDLSHTAVGSATGQADDLRSDLERCIQRLAAADLEMCVVNKTRPDLGLAVAQVIAPGLRHFWPRFAPGRLYDVPVKLGWLQRANAEAELNPVPLFL